ncbi:unnamed protein product [Diplocarpon coronariae]|nr:hypothetical protein JHW43_002352 [Diplocarpon mali]
MDGQVSAPEPCYRTIDDRHGELLRSASRTPGVRHWAGRWLRVDSELADKCQEEGAGGLRRGSRADRDVSGRFPEWPSVSCSQYTRGKSSAAKTELSFQDPFSFPTRQRGGLDPRSFDHERFSSVYGWDSSRRVHTWVPVENPRCDELDSTRSARDPIPRYRIIVSYLYPVLLVVWEEPKIRALMPRFLGATGGSSPEA